MPVYLTELKALIAKQAYEFWKNGNIEPYVSHLNVYAALHHANIFLDFDSVRMMAYNQVGYHQRKITSIIFGKDPNHYYSSSSDGQVLKWNLHEPKTLPELVYESDRIIKSIDISKDGKWLLVVFYQTGVSLVALDASIQKDIDAFDDPEPVQSAIFMPNEGQYLSISSTGVLKLKGFKKETQQIGSTPLDVKTVKVDEKDGTIYTGTDQGILATWTQPYDVASGTFEGVKKEWDQQSYFGYELGTFAINCLDISSDGKMMAIGRERGDVILWNTHDRQIERIISSHQSAITAINFSPDNRHLLTTSRDKTARLWDLTDSRKLPVIFDDHEGWVLTGCFDPSGKQIITGGGDQVIRTWPVDPEVLAQRICQLVDRNMSSEEWEEFVGKDLPYQATCK